MTIVDSLFKLVLNHLEGIRVLMQILFCHGENNRDA